MLQKFVVPVTTSAGQSATEYTPEFTGEIVSITYTKTDFADGVDFAITLDRSGQNVWTEANVNAGVTKAPRQPLHNQDGTAALHAAGGTALLERILAVQDRLKFAITNGGATKSGSFTVIVK